MRKLILAAALAALGAAVVASPAFAIDHHFTVLLKQKSGHRVGQSAFRFKDKLLDPHNRHDRVGRDRGKCRFNPQNGKVKCHATVHLNGEIGGFGNMRVRGDLDHGPDHLVVLGGTRQFDGVAGTMTTHNTSNRRIDRLHFDLVRSGVGPFGRASGCRAQLFPGWREDEVIGPPRTVGQVGSGSGIGTAH
jgi:hypothetical protein